MSRRTVVRGAAWAVPTITVLGAAPALAASGSGAPVPPCVQSIEQAPWQWEVDNVPYPGCRRYRSHRDLRVAFTVTKPCDYDEVAIQVRDVKPPQNPFEASSYCVAGGGILHPTLYLEKQQIVPAQGAATLTFPSTGDTPKYFTSDTQDYADARSTGRQCQVVAPGRNAVNDGIHVNPCYPNGPYIQYRIRYRNNGGAWTTWTAWQGWGDYTTVPHP